MSNAAPQFSLNVGDRVVYPNQGLCNVTEIKAEEIAGQKLVLVSLHVIETGALIKAPETKLQRIGIRRLSSSDDVKKVFDLLKSDSEKVSLKHKERSADNKLLLKEGGLLGLAEVVKGLQVLSELRPLPPKERELYNDARHLFVTELAASLQIAECDAEDALDVVLFPPGKERPKRTAEEFQGLEGEDELGGLGDDLLGLGGEDDSGGSSEEESEEKSEGDGDSDGESDGDEAPAKKPKAAAAAKPVKTKGAAAKPSLISDSEATQTAALALALPKKRGRPPKAKPTEIEIKSAESKSGDNKSRDNKSDMKAAAAVAAPPAEPKKRGRPPKAKPAEEAPPAAPKKRGRPPKAK